MTLKEWIETYRDKNTINDHNKALIVSSDLYEITEFGELPEDFNNEIWISEHKLKNLKGLPKNYNNGIYVIFNEIETLEGLPENFDSEIWIRDNKLKNFKGLPKNFNSEIWLHNNPIESLDGLNDVLLPKNIIGLDNDIIVNEYKRLGKSHLLI